MADYEFFKKAYDFRGKHARMVSELWEKNNYEHTYFKRLLDVYIMGAVLGIRLDRKAEPDYAPVEERTIYLEQMLGAKDELDFIMQMMLMLDDTGNKSADECIRCAFKGAESKEEFERYNKMFESYMLGGVEELYERLVLEGGENSGVGDDKTKDMMELFERFKAHT